MLSVYMLENFWSVYHKSEAEDDKDIPEQIGEDAGVLLRRESLPSGGCALVSRSHRKGLDIQGAVEGAVESRRRD